MVAFHLMSNSELNDLIGQRVRDARKRRDLSVEDVIAKCAKQGLPLTAGQMYLIETRGKEGKPRRRITVDELLTLAYVLEVSPLSLLLPELDGDYPATPETRTTASSVLEWLAGDRLPPLPAPGSADEYSDEDRNKAWFLFNRLVSFVPPASLNPQVRHELERLREHDEQVRRGAEALELFRRERAAGETSEAKVMAEAMLEASQHLLARLESMKTAILNDDPVALAEFRATLERGPERLPPAWRKRGERSGESDDQVD